MLAVYDKAVFFSIFKFWINKVECVFISWMTDWLSLKRNRWLVFYYWVFLLHFFSFQPQMMSPTKSVNTVSLCKFGQDTNQELVNKLLEVFKIFKVVQVTRFSIFFSFHTLYYFLSLASVTRTFLNQFCLSERCPHLVCIRRFRLFSSELPI